MKVLFFKSIRKKKKEVIKIFDNPKIKFAPEQPKAFTKKGCYMLATILTGEKAIPFAAYELV